ncbi:transposase, partial [Listeria seeligeri]
AGVCIEAHDRAALERLLRYCARPPFAMERLRKEGAALVYRCAKQRSEPTSDKRGAKADELTLTPLELIDRIAALVPPPRTHRHRYFGVLAPNSPLRAAAVALATPQQPIKQVVVQTEPAATGEGVPAVAPLGHAIPPTPEPAPPKRAPAHYLWAVLIARIYEVFPLLCPICGGQMRLIAFITEGTQIRRILDHIGVDSEPPQISPARGPPLWDDCDAHVGEGIEVEPDWDLAAQPAPDYEVDQRVNW